MNHRDTEGNCKMQKCKLIICNLQFAICRHAVIRCAVVFLGFLLMWQSPVRADIDQDEAISAGAEALDSWWDYPWYDDQSDSIRRIDLKAKRPTPRPQTASGTSRSWDLEWLGWLLIAVVVLAVLFMLLRLYWTRNHHSRASRQAALIGGPASIDRLEELPFQLEQPAGDLLSAARRAYEQGDYDRAIVFLYSHQLLELDKRQAIHLTKGKTNRQYLRELRSSRGLAPLLATSMVAFEDVFFGGHSLGPERFEECWQQAMQLLERSKHGEAA